MLEDLFAKIVLMDNRVEHLSCNVNQNGTYTFVHYKDKSTYLLNDVIMYDSIEEMLLGVKRREILNRKFK